MKNNIDSQAGGGDDVKEAVKLMNSDRRKQFAKEFYRILSVLQSLLNFFDLFERTTDLENEILLLDLRDLKEEKTI